jgi:CRP-like cAMP-binding protein
MDNERIDFLSHLFPFYGLSGETLSQIASKISFTVSDYKKDDVILSSETKESKIGFIVHGSCEVSRIRSDNEAVPLNNMGKYNSFGILSVFRPEDDYPTRVIAKKDSSVMFITGSDMISLIKEYPEVSMNVICFLVKKVGFLNSKIETFSGKHTTEKLVSYLLNKYEAYGNEFSLTRTKISAELGIGRASLYRDLASLEQEGLIKSDQKKIIIISPEGLERKLK